jgi:hypothetical protein
VKKIGFILAIILAVLSARSYASEGAFFGGPVGGTDMRNAYLPSATGFYLGVVTGGAVANHSYGDNGQLNPAVSAHGSVGVAGLGLLYVYPFHLFGGTLASSVQVSVSTTYLTVNHREEYYRGFTDIYADIIAWSKYIGPLFGNVRSANPSLPYGLTVKLAYSMIFPTGKYNTTQLATPGHNVFFYIPNFAVTYLTGPNFLGDGLEFSAHIFFDISGRNPATNYNSGPIYDIDGAITERFGRWQAGVAGFYARQWEDDTKNGNQVFPNGKRLVSASVGPIIGFDIPEWKANLKFKVTFPVYNRNGFGIVRPYLIFSKAFQ